MKHIIARNFFVGFVAWSFFVQVHFPFWLRGVVPGKKPKSRLLSFILLEIISPNPVNSSVNVYFCKAHMKFLAFQYREMSIFSK